MAFHYMHVISTGPLIIVRTPWPVPRWRDVLKALTPVMHSHGYKRKDIFSVEGCVAYPAERTDKDLAFIERLESGFAGDAEVLPTSWLYDWQGGRFVLVREGR